MNYNTVICIRGAFFTFTGDIPFRIAPSSVTITHGTPLVSLHLKANPIENPATWESDIQEGKTIRWEGIKAGSGQKEVIQMDMRAEKSDRAQPNGKECWNISFSIPNS